MKCVKTYIVVFLILNLGFLTVGNAQKAKERDSSQKDPVDYVDPYIGNIERLLKPTYPTVHMPNSFLRISPARIDYTDVLLKGIPILKAGKASSVFQLSPFQGDKKDIQSVMHYTYDNEEVTPYSYSVILDEYEIQVSLGVSHQAALYSIKFNEQGKPYIILNSKDGRLKWDGKSISGHQLLENGSKAYVYLVPDITPENHYILEDNKLVDRQESIGENASIVLQYSENVKEVILRYGISFIDVKQARKNMGREVASKGLSQLQSEGRSIWNETLGKIKVDSNSADDNTIFYTALYRSHFRPVSISEDGRYFNAADGKVHNDSGVPFYTDDDAWETYRALHPLNALIDSKKEEAVLDSYLRMAEQLDPIRMPEKIDVTGNSAGIHSNHIIVSFADGYYKGLKGFNLGKAYEAGKNAVTKRTLVPYADKPVCALNEYYQEWGYVPAIRHTEKETVTHVNPETKRMAVSVTLGTAYDDWALARLAQALNRSEDLKLFSKRSFNYRNLFNSSTKFFHPKGEDGEFLLPFDYELSGGDEGNLYYTEGNGWTYRFGLQYNLDDLIRMMGGEDTFILGLDELFSKSLGLPKFRHYLQFPTQTGIVGGFAMGNETSFHVPYLYNYVGQPWKTQERIHHLMRQWFRNDLMGMPGDDDGGAMSAFLVFSMMGFYPVTPGVPIYNLGSPIFDHVTIQLLNNKSFEMIAKDNSVENKYIQSATLNGEILNKPWFSHDDILKGGKIVLQMGPRPNKEWGLGENAIPPSMPLID